MIFFSICGVLNLDIFSSPERKALGEHIVLDSSWRPSVRASVCSHFQTLISLRPAVLYQDQISSGASMGWEFDCIRFCAR